MRETRLRRVLEAIGREPCFLEYVTFDIAGHCFRIALRLLGLAVVIQVIRPETLQHPMRPPTVIPALEFSAEEGQVVKSLDDRDSFQPFVFQGFDDSFRHCDGPVFSYGSKAGFDIPLFQ